MFSVLQNISCQKRKIIMSQVHPEHPYLKPIRSFKPSNSDYNSREEAFDVSSADPAPVERNRPRSAAHKTPGSIYFMSSH